MLISFVLTILFIVQLLINFGIYCYLSFHYYGFETASVNFTNFLRTVFSYEVLREDILCLHFRFIILLILAQIRS